MSTIKSITQKELESKIKKMSVHNAYEYLKQIYLENSRQYVVKLIKKYEKIIKHRDDEIKRLEKMSHYEKKAYAIGFKRIAGIDEAGRGPLAGPVVAACVILPPGIIIENINDSKKLTEIQRETIFEEIMQKAVAWEVGIVDNVSIDNCNILNATIKAMETAVNSMDIKPDYLLIDALKLDNIKTAQASIIKGDSKSITIAAASIVAKVTRDRILTEIDSIYPQYGFKKHKGYGTKEHMEAIKKFGICPIHRISFTKKIV